MADHEQIIDRLRRVFANQDNFGPVSGETVLMAEHDIGVQLPLSYRLFLLNFGASMFIAPYEIAGLPDGRSTDPEPPYWSNVIDDTLAMREASRGRIPLSYIPISSDGGDYKFYLDTSTLNFDGDCPVVALGPGLNRAPAGSCFIEFVGMIKAGVQFPREFG